MPHYCSRIGPSLDRIITSLSRKPIYNLNALIVGRSLKSFARTGTLAALITQFQHEEARGYQRNDAKLPSAMSLTKFPKLHLLVDTQTPRLTAFQVDTLKVLKLSHAVATV